ncbi:unnamed protein product [Linum trigynum]|uniref:Uncharacterized protein n=1 Tax=Linum trigynum TaxID=586398 RepID=A0AAV2CZD1_9ROSI
MDVLYDLESCPSGGVGVYNPGFWGMNIEGGKKYKLILYVRSLDSIDVSVLLTGSNGLRTLVTTIIKGPASAVSDWTKVETLLEAVSI